MVIILESLFIQACYFTGAGFCHLEIDVAFWMYAGTTVLIFADLKSNRKIN